jgi:hypothetical protein
MRRSMTVCRFAQLAHQQKAKDGSDKPLLFMPDQARKAAIEAIPDLKRPGRLRAGWRSKSARRRPRGSSSAAEYGSLLKCSFVCGLLGHCGAGEAK